MDIIGIDSFRTDATKNSGMKINRATIHSSVSNSKACRLPGGRSRGSGDIDSQRSTDIAVRVNTLAATATPEYNKDIYKIYLSHEM